jgi:hypothetical protein
MGIGYLFTRAGGCPMIYDGFLSMLLYWLIGVTLHWCLRIDCDPSDSGLRIPV